MKKLNLRTGMDLPKFGNGVVGGPDANEFIMKILQAFVRLQVKNKNTTDTNATQPDFTLSDSNAVLQLPAPGVGGGGTGSANIQVGQITAINQDTWTVIAPAGTLTVKRPFGLKGSIAHANINQYDSSFNLTFIAVSYAYNSDSTQRTETASGYVTETTIIFPPVQPLQTATITSATNSGGNCALVISGPGFTSPPFAIGQFVFFTGGITFTNGQNYQMVQAITDATHFAVSANITGALGAATVSYGGTQILIAQDTSGTWYDLNVDGRKWSNASLLPPP